MSVPCLFATPSSVPIGRSGIRVGCEPRLRCSEFLQSDELAYKEGRIGLINPLLFGDARNGSCAVLSRGSPISKDNRLFIMIDFTNMTDGDGCGDSRR